MKSKTSTLVSALKTLSKDIQSDDGVANACILEAAERLEEMQKILNSLDWEFDLNIKDKGKILN